MPCATRLAAPRCGSRRSEIGHIIRALRHRARRRHRETAGPPARPWRRAPARATRRAPDRTPLSNSIVALPSTASRDRRQHVDRRRRRLELPAAMIGDLNAVEADRDRSLRIVGMHDALHHHRPFPEIAIALDLVPGECAATSRAVIKSAIAPCGSGRHKAPCSRNPAGRCATSAISQAGDAEHLVDRFHARLERHGETVSHFARPLAARRQIDRQHQHMRAGFFRAPDQIEADP